MDQLDELWRELQLENYAVTENGLVAISFREEQTITATIVRMIDCRNLYINSTMLLGITVSDNELRCEILLGVDIRPSSLIESINHLLNRVDLPLKDKIIFIGLELEKRLKLVLESIIYKSNKRAN